MTLRLLIIGSTRHHVLSDHAANIHLQHHNPPSDCTAENGCDGSTAIVSLKHSNLHLLNYNQPAAAGLKRRKDVLSATLITFWFHSHTSIFFSPVLFSSAPPFWRTLLAFLLHMQSWSHARDVRARSVPTCDRWWPTRLITSIVRCGEIRGSQMHVIYSRGTMCCSAVSRCRLPCDNSKTSHWLLRQKETHNYSGFFF